jgi:hypothetical protein
MVFEGNGASPAELHTYRKLSDNDAFGRSTSSQTSPQRLDENLKHLFFRSMFPHEQIRIQEQPSGLSHSYQLRRNQVAKVVYYGTDAAGGSAFPFAAGTSKPELPCVTDGMMACTAVAIGGTSADRSRAKIKVFHINPDINTKWKEALVRYLTRLRSLGISDIRVAMHGGNGGKIWAGADSAADEKMSEDLCATFNEHGAILEINETARRRGGQDTCLGAVIVPTRQGMEVRFINELIAPQ